MEVLSHGAVGDVLVYEEEVAAATRGASVEGYEVGVAEIGEDLDLVQELLLSSVVVLV